MNKIKSILIIFLTIFSFFTQGKTSSLVNILPTSKEEHHTHHKHEHSQASSDSVLNEEGHHHFYPEHCHHDKDVGHHPLDMNNHAHQCQHLSDCCFYFLKEDPNISHFYVSKNITFNQESDYYLSISLDSKLRPPIKV